MLTASVLLTCIGGSFIAVYGANLKWDNVAWIWWYNVAAFLVVDVAKVMFKEAIGESPGDIIVGDELVEVDDNKTETKLHMEKKLRQVVHNQSVVPASDMSHEMQITETQTDLFSQVAQQYREMRSVSITDGYVARRRSVAGGLRHPGSTSLGRIKTISYP